MVVVGANTNKLLLTLTYSYLLSLTSGNVCGSIQTVTNTRTVAWERGGGGDGCVVNAKLKMVNGGEIHSWFFTWFFTTQDPAPPHWSVFHHKGGEPERVVPIRVEGTSQVH